MRDIQAKDFCKLAAGFAGCLAFLVLTVAMEWHHAEFASKVIVVALLMAFTLLIIRALVIYRPQKIDISTLKIERGPCWSSTIFGIRFVWLEVKDEGTRRRIRLVDEACPSDEPEPGATPLGSATTMATTLTKPRRAWLAAILSLLGSPLGQVYAGCFRRSVILWGISAACLPLLMFSLMSLPIGRLGVPFLLLFTVAFPIYWAVDAFRLARRSRDTPLKRYQRWWIYILLYGAIYTANYLVAHAVRSFVAEAFVVPTRSMFPTIQAGDRVLVDKLWTDPGKLRRNDVVVFRSAGPGSELFIMRVVGLPGDQIEIENERVRINGAAWNDVNGVFDVSLPPYAELADYGPKTVPADCFFVLGDNRRRAKDSRILGPIPLSDFYGKARLIYWSRTREFPDPQDTSHYTLGPIHWDRIGTRLD
jgi:signal peptidase I